MCFILKTVMLSNLKEKWLFNGRHFKKETTLFFLFKIWNGFLVLLKLYFRLMFSYVDPYFVHHVIQCETQDWLLFDTSETKSWIYVCDLQCQRMFFSSLNLKIKKIKKNKKKRYFNIEMVHAITQVVIDVMKVPI